MRTTALLVGLLAAFPAATKLPDEVVPFVRLLAVPDSCDGKKVIVKGFASIGFERDGLFASESDFLNGLDGIWLQMVPLVRKKAVSMERHYVIVYGVFHAGRHGHMGGSLSEIDVERIIVLSNPRCPVVETGDPTAECPSK